MGSKDGVLIDNETAAAPEAAEYVDVGIDSDSDGNTWGEFVDTFVETDELSEDSDEDLSAVIVKDEEEVIPPAVDEEVVAPIVEEVNETGVDDEESLDIPAPVVDSTTIPQSQAVAEEALAANREQYRNMLVEHYQMTEEERERFEINPTEELPKFAAVLHMRVLETVMASVQGMLPQAVQGLTQQKSVAERNEAQFFDAWPELKGHDKLIAQRASEFRKQNPQATIEDAVKMVGFQTLLSLGISPEKAAARLTKGFKAPKEQVAAKPPKPHTPAAANRQGGKQRTEVAPSQSVWQEMIEAD